MHLRPLRGRAIFFVRAIFLIYHYSDKMSRLSRPRAFFFFSCAPFYLINYYNGRYQGICGRCAAARFFFLACHFIWSTTNGRYFILGVCSRTFFFVRAIYLV